MEVATDFVERGRYNNAMHPRRQVTKDEPREREGPQHSSSRERVHQRQPRSKSKDTYHSQNVKEFAQAPIDDRSRERDRSNSYVRQNPHLDKLRDEGYLDDKKDHHDSGPPSHRQGSTGAN